MWLEPSMLVQTVVHDPLGGHTANVVDHGQHFKTYWNKVESKISEHDTWQKGNF